MEDVPWDEKDLSDFEISDSGDIEIEEENQENKYYISDSGARQRSEIEEKPDRRAAGFVYPLDFWVLLGDHIAAEDVACFARICQSSHMVTHTVRFWKGIYNRYCKDKILGLLPWDLRPVHIDRTHGLRTRVIRALFYMYSPFINRLRSPQDPDYFQGLKCSWMWHKKNTQGNWIFHFKFEKKDVQLCPFLALKKQASKRKGLTADDNIHNNPEEKYCILQVLCPNFMSLPSIMGLVLTKTSITVSNQGMRYHKLRLYFDHTFCSSNSREESAVTVLTVDPVLKISILPWWHPKYPWP